MAENRSCARAPDSNQELRGPTFVELVRATQESRKSKQDQM